MWGGIIIASIPTAVIGLTLQDLVEGIFTTPAFVGYFLIVTSLLLLVSDRYKGQSQVSGFTAFIIGVVQGGLAVIPGISRAGGATTAVGLLLGIKREEMAEFTFLMSIPAIIGAIILQSKHMSAVPVGELAAYGAGMLAAFISGFFAIGFMVYFIKRASLKAFALYCLIVGGIVAIIWM